MDTIYISSALVSIFIIAFYISDKKFKIPTGAKLFSNPFIPLFIIILLGILSRLFAASLGFIFETDVICFKGWASHIYEYGFGNFYTSETMEFSDYPPGYMYILWLPGFIRSILNLSETSYTALVLMPAIIFDIITSCFIYVTAEKKTGSLFALILALVYSLNPAVIINSSVWGQVDSVYTFFIVFSIFYLIDKKYIISYPLFAVALLIKPQALIFSPLYLFSVYLCFSENKRDTSYCFQSIGLSAALLALGILPFAPRFNFAPVIGQYVDTLASYPYATVNAYNFYAFLGKNWADLSGTLLGVSYSVWGTVFIVAITVASFYMLKKNHEKYNLFFTAAFLNTSTFMFSIKMHERYLYPSILLFLFSFIYLPQAKHKNQVDGSSPSSYPALTDDSNKELGQEILFLCASFSVTLFINCVDILNLSYTSWDYTLIEASSFIVSFVNLMLYVFLLLTAFKSNQLQILSRKRKSVSDFDKYNVSHNSKFTRYDKIFLLTLIAVYAVLAFWRLGDTKSPQTVWAPEIGEPAVVELPEKKIITEISFFPGPKHDGGTTIHISEDGVKWKPLVYLSQNHVLAWRELNINMSDYAMTKYVKFEPDDNAYIMEVVLFDSISKVIPVKLISRAGAELFDEQNLVPDKPTYMNSSYFDEIYYPRTAYEFINQMPPYETTHPPLGKVILALGIKILGLTPFGWRFAGTFFGVLMLPVIYLFARYMFKNSFWAFFACFIFAFDFMHFVQTRLTTIDTYVVFFIMLMYYFMYKYLTMSFYDEPLSKTLKPLLFSGIATGLAIASKWQGAYAVAGIAMIFFYTLLKRYLEYREAQKNGDNSLKKVFYKNTRITILSCIGFFIIIPVIIYVLSYIPFLMTEGAKGFKTIVDNQIYMFTYHTYLVDEHPYSSPWWQWPFMLKPIFYYRADFGSTTIFEFLNGGIQVNKVAGITSFGNPAVWWMGIAAIIFCLLSLRKSESRDIAIFIIIGYASQYLPWILIPRLTFIYHYFPCVPFLVLAITLFFKDYASLKKPGSVRFYLGVVLILFIAFYPVLSGLPVIDIFAELLKWLPMWQLV